MHWYNNVLLEDVYRHRYIRDLDSYSYNGEKAAYGWYDDREIMHARSKL